MKKTRILFIGLIMALILVALPLFSALAQDKLPEPLDPQSWRFAKDMTWDDWHDNTAFNWKVDGSKVTPTEVKRGLLVLVDFIDRPFVVSSPPGSEQLNNPIIGNVPMADLVKFWESFLTDPEDTYNNGMNRGITINEFWRENTQGRWKVELTGCGVYRMPGYEFEYGLADGMQNTADMPAGFTRRSGVHGTALNLAVADGADLSQYDFAFILHSGSAESQVWEEAGYMMFFDQKTIDDFYSARFRIEQMAAQGITIAQTTWNWLDQHDPKKGGDGRGWWAQTRYVPWTSWWGATAIWNSATSTTVNGRSFRLSMQGENAGTAVYAHEFSHISGIADNYGTDIHARTYSGFWDSMCAGSMTGFGGPHTRYEIPNSQGGTVPAHMMTLIKRRLGFLDDNQLRQINYTSLRNNGPVVTEIYARTTAIGDQVAAIYPDTLGVINNKVKAGEAGIGIRLTGFTDAKPRIRSTVDWESDTEAGANRYDNYMIEVVQQVGYDCVQSDSGVLISKNREALGAPFTWVVDAHAGGLDAIDFWTPVGPNGEPSLPQPFRNNDNNHLSAALFHVGKSVTPNDYGVETVRKGQANEDYTVVVNPDGSVNSKSIADNTVNEYIDTYNRLHFYILDKLYSPGPYGGDILSYQIGVRHFDGPAANGALAVAVADVEAEKPGRVAVASFDITNSGDTTDIIRVGVDGVFKGVLLNDLYAVGAGATVTVPVYFEIPANVAAKDVAGQDIVFTASSETNGAKVGVATVAAPDLVIFNFYVYMEAAKADVTIGQTLFVDVMLQGDKNYTQFNASVAYDAARLEFAGFANLFGLAAEVKKDGADKISLRSVPSLNMLQGASCVNPLRIVTLKFTVKDSFAEESIDTQLNFAATAVTPTAGAAVIVAPGKPFPVTLRQIWTKDTPEQSIAKIEVIYPNFIRDEQTQPVFTYSGTNNQNTNTTTIFEEVWIEVPCDTDEDGKRDMIRIEICRPAITGQIIDTDTGETRVSVPVLINHSPYNNSSSGLSGYSPAPSVTTTRRPMWRVVLDLAANPSTADYDYFADVQTDKPRAHEWYWGLEAMYWDYAAKAWALDETGGDPSWYVNARAGIADGAWFIPKSRGNKEIVYKGNWPASPTGASGNNLYFYQRGYAIVTSSSLGNLFKELESGGFNNCGDTEETLVPMAVIKWLNGDPGVKGYTSRAATTEVVATWCNGNVAMTGASYDGTLPIATACSGVDGIKAIMPVAAISSWYDYYRGNGTVIAPDDGWQGEDTDYLAYRCFGWYLNTYYYNSSYETAGMQYYKAAPEIAAPFKSMMDKMGAGQDRGTGDYSEYWDKRNYLTMVDNVPDDCGVMIMHGTNDRNVKPRNSDQFYRALKAANKNVKEVWHLGGHATVWSMADSHYMDYFHLWMDRFLYTLDNDAEHVIPEVNLPSNNNVNWEFYDEWPIAGTTDNRFYFGAPAADKAGGLLTAAPAAAAIGTIKDNTAANTALINPDDVNQNFNRPYPGSTGIVNGQLGNWENRLFAPAAIDSLSSERLVFATDVLAEPLRINGTVRVGLELASDTPWGVISAALVEVGPNYRAFSTVSSNYAISATLSQYKIVTRGHTDVQNPNPAKETYLNAPKAHNYVPAYYYQTQTITPGVSNLYYFEFQPMDYTFKAGTRLALYVYSADYRHTSVAQNPPTFTVYAGANTFADLPIVPTYSIFYNANGGTSLYDALGGYSDSYPIAGQSAAAWEGGYRVVGGVGNTTVAKLVAPAGGTFTGWNTKADGSGTTYRPGDRIPDAQMSDLTLYAQWSGIAAPAVEEVEAAVVVLLEDDEEIVVVE